jgi:hypothetical protein
MGNSFEELGEEGVDDGDGKQCCAYQLDGVSVHRYGFLALFGGRSGAAYIVAQASGSPRVPRLVEVALL